MGIFQTFLLLLIVVMGRFLERLEIKRPNLFGGAILMLMLVFTSLDENSVIHNHNTSPSYTEQIILKMRSGSDPINSKPGFVNTGSGQRNAPTGTKSTGTGTGQGTNTPGNDKKWPGPRFPWGADPKYGRSGSCDVPGDPHQLSGIRNWVSDPSAWEDDERDHSLEVAVDFPYRLNDKNEPTLLVPNLLVNTQSKNFGTFTRVEFEQTATHVHHMPEFGISLPDNFNMPYYLSLNRSGKIAYAKKMLPHTTIIYYQNEIAKQLSPVFNPNTYSVEAIAGQKKVPSQLVIRKPRDLYPLPGQQIQTPVPSGKKDIMLGIITQDDLHVSSFPITNDRLNRIEADNYWVLQKQNIQ